MDSISDRISQCITATGLTKTAFSQKIGLTQAYISALSIGRKIPSDRTIADICREFNVNETWLRTGEGEMFQKTLDTMAGKLAREYGLDDLGCQIMSAYLKLDENDRLAVGRLIQNLLDERTDSPAPVVVSKSETTTPAPERTGADIAAKLAELERRNQELAAEVAAMKEEDVLLGLTDASSASPSASAGSVSPVERVKK